MGLSADEGSVSMSERLTQEVLERAWHAAYDAFSGELLNDLETPNHAVAVAAMRAVLEGHLAAQEPTVPLDTLTSVTVSGARAFWALKDLEKQHEALRVAVLIAISHGPEAD